MNEHATRSGPGPGHRASRRMGPCLPLPPRLLLHIFLSLYLALAPVPPAVAQNPFPIVLVHGFTGWSRSEMQGYHYWGGTDDLALRLTEAGHPTYEAAVGPLSSNWDRACELFAAIKGGRTDYGAAHARRHGHRRFGRSFPGLLPGWGEPGAAARIHLIGHSQGGQTIRVLASLLHAGDARERVEAAQSADAASPPLSPLFAGGRDWVHSITTLATPHDGTTLGIILQQPSSDLLNWLLALGRRFGVGGMKSAYDFKLDQWDISQSPGESDRDYLDRLAASGVWRQRDIALHDLRPEGAAELNRRYPAVPGVWYFSWGARSTVPAPRGIGELPATGIHPILIPTALAIGSFRAPSAGPGLPVFDENWWPSDGVVNTISMSGPKLASDDRVLNLGGGDAAALRPGIWHFMGVRNGWDHFDLVGQQTLLDYRSFYLDWADRLAGLPGADAAGARQP